MLKCYVRLPHMNQRESPRQSEETIQVNCRNRIAYPVELAKHRKLVLFKKKKRKKKTKGELKNKSQKNDRLPISEKYNAPLARSTGVS